MKAGEYPVSDYALVLHDRDAIIDPATGEFVPNARQNASDWTFLDDMEYPAPVKHTSRPVSGDNVARLSPAWYKRIGEVNSVEWWEKARVNWSGVFDATDNPEWPPGYTISLNPDPYPKLNAVTSIMNYVKVLEIRNGAARIECYKYNEVPPMDETYFTHPWKWCHFTSISPEGIVGNAPNGKIGYFPIMAQDEAWIRLDRLQLNVELPKDATMPTTRAVGVDLSQWNGNYMDDGIDEGFPALTFAIIKAWDGNYDRTADPESTFKSQYESVQRFNHVGGYGWYQTEQNPTAQADLALSIDDNGLFDFMPVDYESYLNVIDEQTAADLRTFVDRFKDNTATKVPIYTNGWILTMLRVWLGDWLDKQDIWFAGGTYYNQQLFSIIVDTIQPNISEKWKMWQFSADGNQLADELDFSIVETESIDINLYNGTPQDMTDWLTGLQPPPPPPESLPSFDAGWNAALDIMFTYSEQVRKS